MSPAALDLDKLSESLRSGDPVTMHIFYGLAETERLVEAGAPHQGLARAA